MSRRTLILPILASFLVPAPSYGVKVADVTRISGERTNVIVGMGLVYGLKGTGDGGDFMPAIRPLAGMLTEFANPSNVADLSKAQNVAIVTLTATVPAQGGKMPILALSEGPVQIEDPSTPTVGLVKGGCVMETDLTAKAVDNGR